MPDDVNHNNKMKIDKYESASFGVGFVMAFAWILLFMVLMSSFFPITNSVGGPKAIGYTSGPIDSWILASGIPVFLLLGHLRYARKADPETLANDIKLLKGLAVGFFMWLIVAVYMNYNLDLYQQIWYLFAAAGYITMIIGCIAMKIKWKQHSSGMIIGLLVMFSFIFLYVNLNRGI